MRLKRFVTKATGAQRREATVGRGKAAVLFGLVYVALLGCNTSPDVVSFNTPELCVLERTNIPSFTLAERDCGDGCQVCIATTYEEQAFTYALAHDDCVCPAPEVVTFERLDAHVPDAQVPSKGSTDATADAGPSSGVDTTADWGSFLDAGDSPDTGPEPTIPPSIAPDGCVSQLNLTQGAAAVVCEGKPDCKVCIERVDFDNEPRRYMAHECGCPSPYRSE